MPTYQITVKQGLLDNNKKDKIAEYLTKTHTEITGAPNYFVQIIYHEDNCRRYVAGKLSDNQIWIRGDIRSGRTPDKRSLLVEKFVEGVSEIANVPKSDIWVFLNNLDACDMAEYGQLLSEPGKEQEWFNTLPENIQSKLKEINDEMAI